MDRGTKKNQGKQRKQREINFCDPVSRRRTGHRLNTVKTRQASYTSLSKVDCLTMQKTLTDFDLWAKKRAKVERILTIGQKTSTISDGGPKKV